MTEDRRLAEAELPDPQPRPGEVAVDVAFCGICGSDLHMLPSPAISPGTVMGHEFSGTVAGLGADVEGWSAGDRVCVLPATACGDCPSCKAGQEHLCAEAMVRGHGLGARQGAFAERVVVDPASLFRLPDSVTDEQGALVEPLAVGVHGVRRAGLAPEEPVCVLGAGPIGVMTALALRAMGTEQAIVVEPGDSRRKRIEALGFTALPLDGVHEGVIEALGGELPAAVFECAGHPSGLGLALELVRPAGVIVALGVLEEPVPLNQLLLIVKEASVLGAFAYQLRDFERALELLAAGEIPADELITEVATLDRAQEMVDELRRPGTDQLKVLLRPKP